MGKKTASLGKGDWIVHTYYGVGQIKGVQTKQIENIKTRYFEVEAKNSIFYVPVKNINNERVRPIASQYMVRKAKKILREPPKLMSHDHNLRKRQISERLSDCSLSETAKLIRDLSSRKTEIGLNDHEEKILEKLTERLVLEWSIAQNIDQEKAYQQFEEIIQQSPKQSKTWG